MNYNVLVLCAYTRKKVFRFWLLNVNKPLVAMLINIYYVIVFAHNVKSVSFR